MNSIFFKIELQICIVICKDLCRNCATIWKPTYHMGHELGHYYREAVPLKDSPVRAYLTVMAGQQEGGAGGGAVAVSATPSIQIQNKLCQSDQSSYTAVVSLPQLTPIAKVTPLVSLQRQNCDTSQFCIPFEKYNKNIDNSRNLPNS